MSLLLAGLGNLIRPNPIPWIQDWDAYVETKARDAGIKVISWSFARTQFREGAALFVDARSAGEFNSGHVPGAVSLPFEQLDSSFEILMMLLDTEKPLIIYCRNRDCDDGLLLTQELQAMGKSNLFYFVDGFDAWREAGCLIAAP